MLISDLSSDVCSSDLHSPLLAQSLYDSSSFIPNIVIKYRAIRPRALIWHGHCTATHATIKRGHNEADPGYHPTIQARRGARGADRAWHRRHDSDRGQGDRKITRLNSSH